MGDAPASITLVEDPDDVRQLSFEADAKIAYLTQTTLSVDDANRIITRLKARFSKIASPPKDDICYATQNRQDAVRQVAGDADVVLVVGSRNSSNSQRLWELARSCGARAHLIDGPEDIDPAWFDGNETVLITAGASAPETVVRQCVVLLRERFGAMVETEEGRREDVHFVLPRELRGGSNP
jgi:4-hydroxy-3-methylbut-2-enyl diphosphate reductase